MLKLLSVFIGGGLGSILRFLANIVFKNSLWGTFSVNILGSFVLGFLFYYFAQKFQVSQEIKLFLTVGFCGGLTTFSTFGLESFNLISCGEVSKTIIYITASVAVSLFAVYLGVNFAKQF